MHRVHQAAFAAALFGLPALAAQAAAPGPIDPAQRRFACDGPIFRALSKSALTAAYGASNVSREKVIGAEGRA